MTYRTIGRYSVKAGRVAARVGGKVLSLRAAPARRRSRARRTGAAGRAPLDLPGRGTTHVSTCPARRRTHRPCCSCTGSRPPVR